MQATKYLDNGYTARLCGFGYSWLKPLKRENLRLRMLVAPGADLRLSEEGAILISGSLKQGIWGTAHQKIQPGYLVLEVSKSKV